MGTDVDFYKLPKNAVEPLTEGERSWDYWDVESDAIDCGGWSRRNCMVLDFAARVLCEGDVKPELWQSEFYQITDRQLDKIIELCRAESETAEEDYMREYAANSLIRLEKLRKEFDFESNYLTIKWC